MAIKMSKQIVIIGICIINFIIFNIVNDGEHVGDISLEMLMMLIIFNIIFFLLLRKQKETRTNIGNWIALIGMLFVFNNYFTTLFWIIIGLLFQHDWESYLKKIEKKTKKNKSKKNDNFFSINKFKIYFFTISTLLLIGYFVFQKTLLIAFIGPIFVIYYLIPMFVIDLFKLNFIFFIILGLVYNYLISNIIYYIINIYMNKKTISK